MTSSSEVWRRSRLDPGGAFLVVGDLHNHTTFFAAVVLMVGSAVGLYALFKRVKWL